MVGELLPSSFMYYNCNINSLMMQLKKNNSANNFFNKSNIIIKYAKYFSVNTSKATLLRKILEGKHNSIWQFLIAKKKYFLYKE